MKTRMTKKQRRDKAIAKMIYNIGSMAMFLIGGGIVGATSALIPYWINPSLDFYDYLIWVIIAAFIGMCIMAALAYPIKCGVYKILCKITGSK